MVFSAYAIAGLASLVLVCGFALWKGGPAERAGASVIILTWIVSLGAALIIRNYAKAAPAYLASDAIMAIALLGLAIRYSSLWMGAAMAVQSAVLILRAVYYADADAADTVAHRAHYYVLGQNLASVTLLLIILAATIAAIVRRNRKPPSSDAGPTARTPDAILEPPPKPSADVVPLDPRKRRIIG